MSHQLREDFNKVRPHLRAMADDLDVPLPFVATICYVESRFRTMAMNRISYAAGLFQFIPAVAKEYGLTNPFAPKENCMAAARLMQRNRRYLARRSMPFTLLTAYLAHQQGARGLAQLLDCAMFGIEYRSGARVRNMRANLPESARIDFDAEDTDPGRTRVFLAFWKNHLEKAQAIVEELL